MSESETRWFERAPRDLTASGKRRPGKDLWLRCETCGEILYKPALAERNQVCLHCGHHYKLGARARLALVVDDGSWTEHDEGISPTDPLGFVDSKAYSDRLAASQRKTGRLDAFIAGTCSIGGIAVEIGAFDFAFMGGSMGSVVGECITRVFERAADARRPAIIISSSGGARMQEGILSLMQMAKTCAALARLRDEANQPYISLLTHPTTGGVAASFAMLGDVILAEPDALIGFAGPRVIEQTIGEQLPEGFQTSEYLLEHGMVDQLVTRDVLQERLVELLRWFGAEPETPEGEE
ncbi:MAG: acetyl-CoA carboxylase carboxyltransferase subunit beta [Proteobacteria bacterium]|nr:acetyl-CoA carboxylase carboxyltransferase subunit beta [Pseudomonadota bacterium]MCP4915324.1 acetyl-CoA carboxylase carboxyltransferase subunit beta [Pseudomonadota bacterium]